MCLFLTALKQGVPSYPTVRSGDEGKEDEREVIEVTYTDPETQDTSVLNVPLVVEVAGLEMMKVRMHSSPSMAYRMPEQYGEWFGKIFGFDVVLAYMGAGEDTQWRPVLGNLAPNADVANPRRQEKLDMKRKALEAEREREKQRKMKRGSWIGGVLSSFAPGYFGGAPRGEETVEDTENEGREDDNTPHDINEIEESSAAAEKGEGEERYNIGFADVAPYLVASTASWKNVKERLKGEESDRLDMARFRPNIVVGGVEEAWAEDYWGAMSIHPSSDSAATEGDLMIQLTANCVRCTSLNADYRTGKGSDNVLKSLMGDRRVDRAFRWSPCFGRYGFIDSQKPNAKVNVGDKVQVTKKNEERTTLLWPGLGPTPKDNYWALKLL